MKFAAVVIIGIMALARPVAGQSAPATAAQDSTREYLAAVEDYRRGKKDYAAMPELARTARRLRDTATANMIAADYIRHLRDNELFEKDNLDLMRLFTASSRDRGFALFRRSGARVDSILARRGVAASVVDRVIDAEEIRPVVGAAEAGGPSPDWDRLTATIVGKYGVDAALRTINRAKVRWYERKRDWANWLANVVPRVERDFFNDAGVGSPMGLNNAAYDVFLRTNDRVLLTKALSWAEHAILAEPTSAFIDTYANLLYKLGRTREAIRWAEVGLYVESSQSAKDPGMVERFAAVLEQMKAGKPTWPLEGQ